MDGIKAALLLFVVALLQLAVLTQYSPFRTASVVLVALLSLALLRGSVFGAVAGFGTGLLLDPATLGPLDTALIRRLLTSHEVAVSVEEGSIGGLGAHALTLAADEGLIEGGLTPGTLRMPGVCRGHTNPDTQNAEPAAAAEAVAMLCYGADAA